jgi:hypothetical protein
VIEISLCVLHTLEINLIIRVWTRFIRLPMRPSDGNLSYEWSTVPHDQKNNERKCCYQKLIKDKQTKKMPEEKIQKRRLVEKIFSCQTTLLF